MAYARRVVYGTHVIAQEYLDLEETGTKYVIESQAQRRLGSKSIVATSASQWDNAWTSMDHPDQHWEDQDSIWEAAAGWRGVIDVDGSKKLNPVGSFATTPIKFLYIRNLGQDSDQGLKVSLDGTNYKIYIPPNGSLAFRGATTFIMRNARIDKVTSNTEVEFVIAS